MTTPKIPSALERLRTLQRACAIDGFGHLPVVSRENAADFAMDLHSALTVIDTMAEALKPFAACWEYDDVPRHYPTARYQFNGVDLHLMQDDMRRASAALALLTGGE